MVTVAVKTDRMVTPIIIQIKPYARAMMVLGVVSPYLKL